MKGKAFGLRIFIIIRITNIVEGRKEKKNNWKKYYSISKARKVRLKIVALYYNIFKVSQVLAFLILGYYSFPFYKQMEKAPRLIYGITKVYNL